MRIISTKFSLLTIFFLTSLFGMGQKENGAILKLDDGSKIVGQYIEDTTTPNIHKIVILTGDTLSIDKWYVSYARLPKDVSLFKRAKFHYKSGFLGYTDLGFSGRHFQMNVAFSKIFQEKFEIGAGMGVHYNTLVVPATTFSHWIDVTSFPVFAFGKYYLNSSPSKLYVKGTAGISNNLQSWNMQSINNGVMFEGGIGVSFASKRRYKWYLELSQYTSRAKGTSVRREWSNGWDQPSSTTDIDFSVWFNRITFKVGMLFGN